jgi:hypothetical protein
LVAVFVETNVPVQVAVLVETVVPVEVAVFVAARLVDVGVKVAVLATSGSAGFPFVEQLTIIPPALSAITAKTNILTIKFLLIYFLF